MFALLQYEHKSQLEAMTAANKVTINAMMDKQVKENTPPSTYANNGGKDIANKVKYKKKLCPHCNLFVFHKPDRCYELDANKGK
jgi:hypothetical protein